MVPHRAYPKMVYDEDLSDYTTLGGEDPSPLQLNVSPDLAYSNVNTEE